MKLKLEDILKSECNISQNGEDDWINNFSMSDIRYMMIKRR